MLRFRSEHFLQKIRLMNKSTYFLLVLLFLSAFVAKSFAQDKNALGEKLYSAADNGQTEIALDLIKQGANLNYQGSSGTALNRAALGKNLLLVKALLEAGADPNLSDSLLQAVYVNSVEMVELFLKYKADANVFHKENGYNALHIAALWNSDAKVTALMLAAGTDPKKSGNAGETPLSIARGENKTAIINALTSGAKTVQNKAASNDSSEGYLARALDNIAADSAVSTKLLDGYLAQIDQMFAGKPIFTKSFAPGDSQLGKELYNAAKNKNSPLAFDLIKRGADVNYAGEYQTTALYYAAENGDLALVKALLESGANPDSGAPLYHAAGKDNVLLAALLIKYKANVNATYNSSGSTFLHAAATFGKDERATALLIEAGANRLAVDNSGKTALAAAERYGKEKIALLLAGSAESVEDARRARLAEVEAKKQQANADFASKQRQAVSAYNIAHRDLEFAIANYQSAVKKYNSAGEAQFLYKGTLARAYSSLDRARGIINNLLKEYGKYLPQALYDHIMEDYGKIPSSPY
jgi:ankyrin repeat protein